MDNSQISILLAEDEDSLRNMLVTILREEDYQVDDATDGREAWDFMKKNHYDLLMTDLYMPHMNGIELIQRCQSSSPTTKTILFSGGGKEVEAQHGTRDVKFRDQEITVDVFLKKPCNLNEMLSFIERLLQQ